MESIESKLEELNENHVAFTNAVEKVLKSHVSVEDIAGLRRLAHRLHLPAMDTDALLSNHEHNWDSLTDIACFNKTLREAHQEIGHLLSLANCLVRHNAAQHDNLLQEIIALNIDLGEVSVSYEDSPTASSAAKLHAYLKVLTSLRHRLSAAIDAHIDTLTTGLNQRVVVVCDEQQKNQQDLLDKMSELQELMSQRFNTIEHKLRSVSNQVAVSMSSLQALINGDTDCPHLFIALPSSTSTHILTDTSLRVYPLCGYSYEPVGDGYELHHTSTHHDQVLSLLHFSSAILTSIASNPFSSVLLPSLTLSATQFIAQYINSYTASIDKSQSQYISISPKLTSFQAHVSSTSNLADALQSIDQDTLHSIQPILGDAYAQIRALLEAQDPGLRSLRCLMAPCVSLQGDVAWVKYEYMSAYKYAVATSPSPTKQLLQNDIYEESTLPEYDPINHLPHPDPWVVIAPVTLSEDSSVYVAALCNWLESQAALNVEESRELAVLLVMDECLHIAMLRDRLQKCCKYLHNLGVTSANEHAIKRALFQDEGTSVLSSWFR